MNYFLIITRLLFQVNLKRSREDHRPSPPRLKLNQCKSAIIVLHTNERGNLIKPDCNHHQTYQDEFYIDEVRLANDSDKELISPPMKVGAKSCDVTAEMGRFHFEHHGEKQLLPAEDEEEHVEKTKGGQDVESLDNVESEYSSLDDEEEDGADDDDDLNVGDGGKHIGDDVFDAMVSEIIPVAAEPLKGDHQKQRVNGHHPQESSCVNGSYSGDGPLCQSLFPNVPVFLTFATDTEPGPPLPPCVTKILKWKLTAVTPVVVRKVLMNSGFRLLKRELV